MEKIIKTAFLGLAIIVLIFLFHYFGWLNKVENSAIVILSPIERSGQNFNLSVKSFYNSWIKKRDLLKENGALIKEVENIQIDQAKVSALQEENDLLKKELAFTLEIKAKSVSAKIISGLSDAISQSVIINRGSKDGVTKGLAVVSDNGVMVGKVYEVYDNFSKVLLLTDNKSLVAATIQNLDHTAGLVQGQFGLSFSMTNIPQNQEVKPGDLVVTSGLEGKIPKNLLIAQVENINGLESEIFKTATLKPIVSFDKLSYVLVIIP